MYLLGKYPYDMRYNAQSTGHYGKITIILQLIQFTLKIFLPSLPLTHVRAEINACNAKDTIQSSRKISSQTDCLIAVLYIPQ